MSNTVQTNPGTPSNPTIEVDAGNSTSVSDSVCLNASSNTLPSSGNPAIGLWKQTAGVTNPFALHGLPASQTDAQVTTVCEGSEPVHHVHGRTDRAPR